jgi:hypothetical protein
LDPDTGLQIRILKVFFLLVTVGTFISVFRDKKLLRSHKTVEIMVFQYFCLFHVPEPDPDHYKWLRIQIRIVEVHKTYESYGSGSVKLVTSERWRIYISRGPTFGDFVTIRTEGSMQDVSVARLQSTRVQTPLSFKCKCTA